MENETDELKNQKKHVRKIYSNKAKNLLKYSIIVFLISFFTYFYEFTFDFGIIFEGLAFILVLISIHLINKDEIIAAKKLNLVALFCIAWLIVYDVFDIINATITYKYFSLYFIDFTLIFNVFFIYKSYVSICKALNEEEYKETTDWFYDNNKPKL